MLRSTAESEKKDDESDHEEYDARNGHHLRLVDRPTAPRSNADDRNEGDQDGDDHCRESHGMSLHAGRRDSYARCTYSSGSFGGEFTVDENA